MTHNEARNYLQVAFRAGWNDTTYPVGYDNANFTPPTGTGAWARFSINFLAGKQISIGPTDHRLFERLGMIVIRVFTSANDNTYNNDTLCATALNLFDGKTISNVQCFESSIETVGADEEGKWYAQDVIIFFKFYDVK